MLNVTPVPILSDNYVWLIHSPDGRECIIVDPGATEQVIDTLRSKSLNPVAILITHSHYDHVDGIADLVDKFAIPVYGPRSDAIPHVSKVLRPGDSFELWGQQIQVLGVPGHMPEHLAYLFIAGERPQLFSGDVIFSSGCGRIFVGTHEELKTSLDTIKDLPDNTMVYPTHEYTLANLNFALAVEPDNEEIKERQRKVRELRQNNTPSLPTTIALEKKVNPFLRCDHQEVIKSAANQLQSPVNAELATFTALRKWKDRF